MLSNDIAVSRAVNEQFFEQIKETLKRMRNDDAHICGGWAGMTAGMTTQKLLLFML